MIDLLTIVYGDRFIEIFRRGALKSLLYPKNADALTKNEACWNIFTEDKFIPTLKILTESVKGIKFNIQSTSLLRRFVDQPQSALVWQIEKCLKENRKLLFAPPDTIFGEGSVEALTKVGREKHSCVSIPHPRVVPNILEELNHEPKMNPQLVGLAWKHLHRSWSEAETGCERQNSFVGGVSWQKVKEKTYSITHRLPTVYLADFTDEDLNYFRVALSFGAWDHTWPGDVLYPRGRQRLISSSDLAFVCEVTEKDKNIPPIIANQNPDEFWKNSHHNHINKQIVATFRAE